MIRSKSFHAKPETVRITTPSARARTGVPTGAIRSHQWWMPSVVAFLYGRPPPGILGYSDGKFLTATGTTYLSVFLASDIRAAVFDRYSRADALYAKESASSLSFAVAPDTESAAFDFSENDADASRAFRAYKKRASSERSANSTNSDSSRMNGTESEDAGRRFQEDERKSSSDFPGQFEETVTGRMSVRIPDGETEDQTAFATVAQSPTREYFLSDDSGYRTVTSVLFSFSSAGTISGFAEATTLGEGSGAESFSA